MDRATIKNLLLAVLYEGKQCLLNAGLNNADNPIKVASAAIEVFEGTNAKGEDVVTLIESILCR